MARSIFLHVVLLFWSGLAFPGSARPAPVMLRDSLVVPRFCTETDLASLQVTPRGDHWIAAVRRGKQQALLQDGRELGLFDEVGALYFTNDGQHTVTFARRDGHWVVLLDGVGGPAFDEIGALLRADSSAHIIYTGRQGDQWYVVRDTIVIDSCAGFHSASTLAISADGTRFAYVPRRGPDWVVATDARDYPLTQEFVAGPCISPNGKQLAWVVRTGRKECRLMLNNQSVAVFDRLPENMPPCQWSADSRHYARPAQDGNRYQWVTDRDMSVPGDRFGPAVFTADGEHFLSAVYRKTDKKWIVMRDFSAVKVAPAGGIVAAIGASADGRRVACAMLFTTKAGQQIAVGVDSLNSRQWDNVGQFVFSPNGRHFAYDAVSGVTRGPRPLLAPKGWSPYADWSTARRSVMVDNEELPNLESAIEGAISFTGPDTLRILVRRPDGIHAVDYFLP